jgi:hypothetical protein
MGHRQPDTMPFVEGESLRFAHALGRAHALGIVQPGDQAGEHPVLEGGHAVVSDLGIARAVSAPGAGTLTETGLMESMDRPLPQTSWV